MDFTRKLTVFEIAAPDCVAEEFGQEIVVLNVSSGVYYSLRGLGAAVWRDLAAGHPIELVLRGIRDLEQNVADEVAVFAHELVTLKLLRPADVSDVPSKAPECIELIRCGETKLTIEAFEDLRELILADPIHDADAEVGWPALQQEAQLHK